MRKWKRRGNGSGVVVFNITIYKNIRIVQKAVGGGQINRHVGTNANQGGQIATKRSKNRQ